MKSPVLPTERSPQKDVMVLFLGIPVTLLSAIPKIDAKNSGETSLSVLSSPSIAVGPKEGCRQPLEKPGFPYPSCLELQIQCVKLYFRKPYREEHIRPFWDVH